MGEEAPKEFTIDKDLRIYKISSINRADQSTQTYVLKVCDPRMFTVRNTRVNRVMRGSYDKMLQNVLINEGHMQTDEFVHWEDSKPDNQQMVVPNWTIDKFIDFSVNNADKLDAIPIARDLLELGFKLVATLGTAKELAKNGLEVSTVFKVGEGRPNIVDGIKNGEINLVINTPMGARARYDEESIGRACIQHGIVAITTLSGANAALRAIRVASKKIELDSIQNYHL